jgi:hypothetical protein
MPVLSLSKRPAIKVFAGMARSYSQNAIAVRGWIKART